MRDILTRTIVLSLMRFTKSSKLKVSVSGGKWWILCLKKMEVIDDLTQHSGYHTWLGGRHCWEEYE